MIYYKWIYSDKNTILETPGSVWTSINDAIKMKDYVVDWIYSPDGTGQTPFNLYKMHGPKPYEINTLYRANLITRTQHNPLTPKEFQNAVKYIESKPQDFFGLAMSTKEDETLFRRIAATTGALLMTVDPWGMGVLEAVIAVPTLMEKINPTDISHLVF